MRFTSGLSTHPDPATSLGEVLGRVAEQIDPNPDLVVIFAAGAHAEALPEIVPAVQAMLNPGALLAVTASGVLGGTEEIETGDALSVWAGHSGSPLQTLRLDALGGSSRAILGLPSELGSGSTLLLLADPFSFPVELLLAGLAETSPDVAVVGGLASGAQSPGGNRLWINELEYHDGAVGVVLPPGFAQAVVSQGCRPIGSPWVITAGEGQLMTALGGQPAMKRLEQMLDSISPEDRALASRGLLIGVVANDQREQFEQGDFLIRGVMGRSGDAVAIGAAVEVGQVVQFHVRDAASATHDLVEQLDGRGAPALVFSCNGRGEHMFGEPHHDAQVIGGESPSPALAGMFCAGEIGPVGSQNAVHAFTSTILIFDNQ